MRTSAYLRLQCLRALKLLPRVLAVTLLLLAAASLIGVMLSDAGNEDAAGQKVLIGVVGDLDDPYISLGVHALEHFDASRFSLEFIFMDETEAVARLRGKELSAYLVIPENFVQSIYAGDVRPIRYISLSGANGTNVLLITDVAEAVSGLMLETENALFGAQDYIRDRLPGVDAYASDLELTDRYFALALSRDRLFTVETRGVAGALSTEAYYLCGIVVAFLLLWGVSCSPLFSGRSEELCRALRARGCLGVPGQVLGEFIPFFGLMCLGALCVGAASLRFLVLFGLAVSAGGISVPGVITVLLPFVLMLCAMQFFLYELDPSPVGGILLQFLNGVTQAYICGCFYPYTFFPESVQAVGAVLPAGLGLRCLGGLLTGTGGGAYAAAALAWALGFLALAMLVRRQRLAR